MASPQKQSSAVGRSIRVPLSRVMAISRTFSWVRWPSQGVWQGMAGLWFILVNVVVLLPGFSRLEMHIEEHPDRWDRSSSTASRMTVRCSRMGHAIHQENTHLLGRLCKSPGITVAGPTKLPHHWLNSTKHKEIHCTGTVRDTNSH